MSQKDLESPYGAAGFPFEVNKPGALPRRLTRAELDTRGVRRNPLMPLPEAARVFLGSVAPTGLSALGGTSLLKKDKLAVTGSSRCLVTVLIATHELAKTWAEGKRTIIGGFHGGAGAEAQRVSRSFDR